jgi:ATP-dependent helicase/nuclease subunit B
LAWLSHRFGPEAVFSASQIDTYNKCPWHFFARYVLGLQELDWPQRRLEPVTRGLFIHKVLFRLFVALRENFGVAIPAMPALRSAGEPTTAHAARQPAGPPIGVKLALIPEDALLAQLDAAIDAESAEAQVANTPFPVLWEAQLTTMRLQLHQYIMDQRASAPAGCAGIFFELSFGAAGPGHVQAQPADPASQSEPVSITTPGGPIHLAGRIDRVDYLCGPWGSGTMVVDYKTGALPSAKALRDNRRLQLPLYIEAMEVLTGASSVGGALHAVRDDLAFRYYSWLFPKESDPQTLAQLRAGAMARVGQIIRSIRQGTFDLAPLEDCRGCEFRQICHYSKARSLVKESPAQGGDAALEKAQ